MDHLLKTLRPGEALDLTSFLVTHPNTTFVLRAADGSMSEAHIPSGACLVTDRSITPWNGATVVALLNGAFTVKTYERNMNGIRLLPANCAYQLIQVNGLMDFEVWAVVTRVILVTDQ